MNPPSITVDIFCPSLDREGAKRQYQVSIAKACGRGPEDWDTISGPLARGLNWDYMIPSLRDHDDVDFDLRAVIQRERHPRPLTVIVNEFVAWSIADVVIVLADHVRIEREAMDKVLYWIEARGGDMDFMLGLPIDNEPDYREGVSDSCFFALGRQFMNRFPRGQVFCPDFRHFYADTELGRYARSIQRFWSYRDQGMVVTSQNPRTDPSVPVDATYRASREFHARDTEIARQRSAQELLWGESWELVRQD